MDGLHPSEQSDPTSSSFTWDEFCNLLDVQSSGNLLSTSRHPVDLVKRLTCTGQYFFETNAGKRTIEVFWLKLCLSQSLCSIVAEQHERYHRSYGVLEPRQVMIAFSTRSGNLLPFRWTASVSVRDVDPNEGFLYSDMPQEMARGISAIPVGVDLIYAAPQIRQAASGRQMAVTALIESADLIPDDESQDVRGLVRVHLIADEILGRDISDEDVFRVMLPVGGRGGGIGIWGRKVTLPERGIVVSGMTDAMSPDLWSALEQSLGQVRSTAKATIYRSSLPDHDVFSCGILLLRALLGAEAGRWEQVVKVLPTLWDGLSPLVQGVEDQDHYTIHVRVRDRLGEWGDLFMNKHLPQEVWWDALVAAFRACSRIEGFSYSYGEASPDRSVARKFADDLVTLAIRARMELFEARDRDALIAHACDRVLA